MHLPFYIIVLNFFTSNIHKSLFEEKWWDPKKNLKKKVQQQAKYFLSLWNICRGPFYLIFIDGKQWNIHHMTKWQEENNWNLLIRLANHELQLITRCDPKYLNVLVSNYFTYFGFKSSTHITELYPPMGTVHRKLFQCSQFLFYFFF